MLVWLAQKLKFFLLIKNEMKSFKDTLIKFKTIALKFQYFLGRNLYISM